MCDYGKEALKVCLYGKRAMKIIPFQTFRKRTIQKVAQILRRTSRNYSTSVSDLTVHHLDRDLSSVAVLTLSRESRRNALSRGLVDSLRREVANIRVQGSSVSALIIKSSRPEVFCAGADLKERATLSPIAARTLSGDLRCAFTELATLQCPTIAVVDGFALGGGAELALACDLRVAGPKAEFGFPETGLAIIPGAGGTQRLPRLIGISKAKDLILTGRRVQAAEADRIGLADYVASGEKGDTAFDKALSLARRMAECGPLALQLAKVAIDGGVETDISTGLALEAACYYQTISTNDRNEGVAAFNERRKPVYTGS